MFPRTSASGFLAAVLLSCSAVMAQDASVTGIVKDALGAAVPQVSITIRNVDTGIDRKVATSETGDFTITNLAPGSYELSAEMEGFRKYSKTGIVLEVGQVLRNDIALEVGQLTESISVTAEVAALNTESGTIKGDVIVQQEIEDLPLDGRDFTDLAMLVPGVMPKAQGGQGSALAVNGARADSTNFYVDGFNNRNARGATAQVRPNMGAMQEFKMEVSGYSAEIGRMAGGVLNMVMRSGTNRFHGDLFEFARNSVIDSRSFFDPEKQKLNRHQFGGTLHGPVILPGLYNGRNRTFFLFSWESQKQFIGRTSLTHVPSLLERNLDFSQSFSRTLSSLVVTDPLNGNAPFPGNVIPASRMHPVSQKLMAYFPEPNRADPRFNYIAFANDEDTWHSPIIKIDHRFNEKNSLSYRYQIRLNDTGDPFAGSELGTFGNRQDNNRSLMGLDYTHLFTSTLLVEVRSGFSRNASRQNSIWGGQDIAGELGLTGSTQDPDLIGFPRFTVQDYAALGSSSNQPVHHFVTDIQHSAKFTWVKSRHVMKWGFEHSRVRFNEPYFNNNRGTFNFNGAWTSAPLADFVLGMMNQTTRQIGINRNYLRATSIGAFFNDDFKLRPNLTLNLGIRYELDNIPHDRYNHLTNFVPELGKVVLAFDDPSVKQVVTDAGLEERVTHAEAAGLPRSLVYPDYNNIAPRVGFAWRPRNTTRTVIRGGYGIFYTGHLLNPFRNRLSNTFPYALDETYSRNANRPDLVTLSNPFPSNRLKVGGINTSAGYQVNARTGYMQSYNLTVEREFFGQVIEIGYVGSRGTHLGRLRDVNLPRRSEAAYLAGIANIDLRPFPFFNGTINQFQFHSNSFYSAGQISLRRRGRGGTFYRLNYSYSKSLDDASQIQGASDGGLVAAAQDVTNHRLDRGRSDWDRGHIVSGSFSWQLPVGRGRRWLGSARGLSQGMFGGWQLSGTAWLATGQPLTVTTAGVDLNMGESQKPNRIGKGIPDPVPGQRRGVDYPWYNLRDFVEVPQCVSREVGCPLDAHGFKPFTYGNAGRNILDGPGLAYMNLSLMKNFRFGEQKNVQVRLASFNVVNHPNFQLPNRQFNSSGGGRITSVVGSGRGGPRVFQAGLRFQF